MTYEDFTTYIEVDHADYIQVAANHIDIKTNRGYDDYVYKDKGSGHFTNFEHKIDFYIATMASLGKVGVYAVANDIDDFNHFVLANIKTQAGNFTSAPYYRLYFMAYDGANSYSNYLAISLTTWYYLRIKKDGTSVRLRIWTSNTDRDNDDIGAASYVGAVEFTLSQDCNFQYIYPCGSWNTGNIGYEVNTDIENLDLQEGGAILKEVADSLSLSDSLLCNKTFAVTDSVGLADAPLKHWTPQISDSIALSDAVLRNKTFQILDSLGLSDTILRGKQFSVSDSISLCELITVITETIKQVTDSLSLSDILGLNKTLLVADQIRLTDNVYVNKILIISDSMALAEVVEKSVQGVVKTRIFLIIGDLAIQLTG